MPLPTILPASLPLAAASGGGTLVAITNAGITLLATALQTPGANVANGSGCVIAATSAKLFVWDSGTSLWYSVGG